MESDKIKRFERQIKDEVSIEEKIQVDATKRD
jgi:hypothetical protein